MQQRLREARQNRDGGFTLIELLIVIVVLGILATIVVFGVAQFQTDAEKAACNAQVKTVETAIEAYRAAEGDGNPTLDQLVAAKYLKSNPNVDGQPARITITAGVPSAGPGCGKA